MAIDSDMWSSRYDSLQSRIDIISTGLMIHRFTHTKQRGAVNYMPSLMPSCFSLGCLKLLY
ncbi:Uncharacterised protein [uncultured archaeon]|nr:Uncharacterised protein [uncultured archaeon]